jgi:hypothetical protein
VLETLKNLINQLPHNVTEALWTFFAGSVLTFFRSVVDGTRRSAKALALGCIFGGLGATVAYEMFAGSEWRVFWSGCAAVIAENFVVGLFNASKRFRENPIETFKDLWVTLTLNLSMPFKETTKNDKPPTGPAAD